MEKTRVLSGAALVAKGITKIEASLPEIGLKDVAPNGSWLEQKQIQAALEARKYLIEVERIEKCGVLSHAIWRDDLKLAEVTQKSGGHWQYLGHNVGKMLFLNPEETLFLMETNCLQLKHNEVTVSLQKAYALLLDSSNRIQYQVYASLSRVGYKVFRHAGPKWNVVIKSHSQEVHNVKEVDHVDTTVSSQLEDSQSTNDSTSEDNTKSDNNESSLKTVDDNVKNVDCIETNKTIGAENKDTSKSEQISSTVGTDNEALDPKDVERTDNQGKSAEVFAIEISKSLDSQESTENCNAISETCVEKEYPNKMHVDDKEIKTSITGMEISDDKIEDTTAIKETNCTETSNVLVDPETVKSKENLNEKVSMNTSQSDSNIDVQTKKFQHNYKQSAYSYVSKIDKMTKRQMKPSDSRNIQTYFDNIPDLSKQRVFAINVPDQQFIPKNVFVNKENYVLDMQNIKARSRRSASSETASYSSSDEVNGRNIRRIRSSSGTELSRNQQCIPNMRLPRYQFRPYGFWRPQNSINFYQLMFFQTRFQYNQRPPPFSRSYEFSPNASDARKRLRICNIAHFQAIRNAAVRLKQSLISGVTDMRKLEELHNILHSYNTRYKTRLRLSENFDVINEEKIIETIELDDDEESRSKRPRLEDGDDKFDENLYRLKQLALRLRELESKDKATASHRRAFSKAIKTFNQSYKADIYLDTNNYEVIDRKCITLDSSSESDCVVEEAPAPKRKKLRNPFNILKRRSEKLSALNGPSTSQAVVSEVSKAESNVGENKKVDNNKYSDHLLKTFKEEWLPKEDDFGRAEIVSKLDTNTRLLVNSKEQYLQEFMKDQLQQYSNCESAGVPSASHVMALHSKYNDEVPIVFAVVGLGSVSYIQLNPIDLPIYVPNNDLV
ncbi:hypothetical protein HF086_007271 [Spodoptera exigua]|uniref:tRNA-splicing endonuclease subunit Sen54 N-terminal domain-containing protein n=1 Tax=Spodoptera exigua TaxID=7107 RepID=A0A922SK34_SPOEX|nr:hypothetical protein HF086_007271 [Spodoptera exigua]